MRPRIVVTGIGVVCRLGRTATKMWESLTTPQSSANAADGRADFDGRIDQFIAERYKTWDSGVGAEVESGKTSLASLEKYALSNPEPMVASGRQEMIEGLLNEFI